MAEIVYVTGDLLASSEAVIVHGCNAQGVMGSGIAGLIRKKWPVVFDVYRQHYENHLGADILGEVIWVAPDDAPVIANAITQKFYGGNKGIRYCSYDAIDKAFATINQTAQESGTNRVAMPLIGAGLANGSWSVIKAIIEANAISFTPVVYLLDGVVPSS